jgi:hypothetical protein
MRSRASLAPLSVRKVCQLTGERDRARGTLAFNQTETNFGFFGTDLGSSFEHGGRLWFLFGDTWPGPGPATDSDCVAWTMDTNPEPGIHLHFVTGAPKKYKSPVLRDRNGSFLKTAGFEVPIAGVSAGGRMYVFYSTDAFEERGGDGGLDAFWFGADGSVGTAWANPTVDSGNWHPPFPATPPGAARAGSRIAAVTRFEDALDIFWIGLDGAVGTTWANPRNDDAKWHPPFPITPPGATRADSPLAAVTRLDGALDAFWMGPDGAVDTTWANPRVDGAKWHPPFPITPPGAARPGSPLAAVTRLDGALDVFWIGPDGAVGTTWANPQVDGGRWHPPFPITPPGATRADSPLAAVTRLEGALDVFWIGPDSAVGTTWANPRIDGARWHAPFPISPPGVAGQASSLAALTRRSGGTRVLMGRTVLTSAVNNDPTDLVALYDMSRLDRGGKFINVACAVAPNGVDGLSGAGPFLVAWGSGRYRDSDVFLGAVPLHDIRNPAAWRFFSGSAGVPWVTDQRAAAPLFLHRVVGELSVSWVEPLGLWLMLYNAPMPRGIVGRVAEHPWGPWSDTFLVFDPGWPGLGYGHFMHEKDGSDGVSDPGREHEWGGEYGPYLIDRYTRAVATASQDVRQARIYFVMSTWNPYNTVLMTAIIQREPDG